MLFLALVVQVDVSGGLATHLNDTVRVRVLGHKVGREVDSQVVQALHVGKRLLVFGLLALKLGLDFGPLLVQFLLVVLAG